MVTIYRKKEGRTIKQRYTISLTLNLRHCTNSISILLGNRDEALYASLSELSAFDVGTFPKYITIETVNYRIYF